MKYPEYLKTTHFLNVKKRALQFWGYKCCLCSNPNNLHIHHNSYSWFEEKDNDVVVLCKGCHKKFHDVELNNATIEKPSETPNAVYKLSSKWDEFTSSHSKEEIEGEVKRRRAITDRGRERSQLVRQVALAKGETEIKKLLTEIDQLDQKGYDI